MGRTPRAGEANPPRPLQAVTTDELLRELVMRSIGDQAPSVWLTPADVAEILGISVALVYRACHLQGLKHLRMDDKPRGVIRVRRDWLDQWLQGRAVVKG
jgi:excisionase family DNA binding protein